MRKKIYMYLCILILIALVGFLAYNKIKQIRINDECKNNLNCIVDMGAAENIPNAYYYVVNEQRDVDTLIYRCDIFLDQVIYNYVEYSFLDILLNNVGEFDGNRIVTYVDVASGEIVNSIDLEKTIGEKNAYWKDVITIIFDDTPTLVSQYRKRNPYSGEMSKNYYESIYFIDSHSLITNELKNTSRSQEFVQQIHKIIVETENKAINQHIMTNEMFLKANNLDGRIVSIYNGHLDSNLYGYIYILDITDLPRDNALFEAEFLKLSELASGMPEGYVLIQLPYEISAEEVVKLFSDNCAEITFEDVYIDEHDSIDGQIHYVDSVEEYNEYINTDVATFSYNFEFYGGEL